MSARRILSWSILLALVAFGLFWPALSFGSERDAAKADPVTFTDYRADFTVAADGRLSAVETVTGSFPAGRHGLVRAFSDANAYAPHIRQLPTDLTAQIDGAPAEIDTSWEDSTTYLARIGDPGRVLPSGLHVVTIRYSVAGVLDPGGTGADRSFKTSIGEPRDSASIFLWQVVPSWNNEIDHAHISLTLPGPALGAGCSVGVGSRERRCVGFTVADDTVTIEASDVDPHAPITVRVGTDVPTPARSYLPWTPRFDGVFGRSLAGLAWPLAFTLFAMIGALLWLRGTRDGSIPAPVQHAPPDGLGPAQWDYIRTLKVGPNALAATLLHLAENGLITLTEVTESRWIVTGVADQTAWNAVDVVSRDVGAALHLNRPGEVLNANGTGAAGKRLTAARRKIVSGVESWAKGRQLLSSNGRRDAIELRCIGVAALAVTALFLPWLDLPTVWGLPGAVVFLISLPAWRADAGIRRTGAGRDMASKAIGFHRLLSTDSSEARFDFAGRSGVYTTYLPYAVAAGVAAQWAAKFEKVTGTTPPEPSWSLLGSPDSMGALGLAGLQSTIATSIDTYVPVNSSGSGGGSSGGHDGGYSGGYDGGGGFSGGDGGGGGGGGGSW